MVIESIQCNGVPANNVIDTEISFVSQEKSYSKAKKTIPYNVFAFIFDGEPEILTSTSHAQIKSKEFLLMRKGTAILSEKSEESKTNNYLLFHFTDDVVLEFCLKFDIQPQTSNLEEDLSLVTFPQDNFIYHFVKSLKGLKSLGLIENKLLQRVKFDELLYYILQKHPAKVMSFLSEILTHKNECKFKRIVLSNVDKNLTIDELAFLCNMSLSTFKRHFNQTFNTSPKKFFKDMKMTKAKTLLKQNLKPSEIYYLVGYENLSAFCNEFKKYFGIAPKAYQSQNELIEV